MCFKTIFFICFLIAASAARTKTEEDNGGEREGNYRGNLRKSEREAREEREETSGGESEEKGEPQTRERAQLPPPATSHPYSFFSFGYAIPDHQHDQRLGVPIQNRVPALHTPHHPTPWFQPFSDEQLKPFEYHPGRQVYQQHLQNQPYQQPLHLPHLHPQQHHQVRQNPHRHQQRQQHQQHVQPRPQQLQQQQQHHQHHTEYQRVPIGIIPVSPVPDHLRSLLPVTRIASPVPYQLGYSPTVTPFGYVPHLAPPVAYLAQPTPVTATAASVSHGAQIAVPVASPLIDAPYQESGEYQTPKPYDE